MRTRTEQVQAYRFVTRRIVSALLSGEPETTERPMRRFGMAIFGSSMVAAIIFAGVGVYGFINPSGAALENNSIVVERESGARYVYVDGKLHPVLNYASARLIVKEENPAIRTVSQRSLRNYPRGPLVGIPNAPDALPDRRSLATGPWSVCSQPLTEGSQEYVTQLIVNDVPPGGEPLGDRALLATRRTTQGGVSRYFIWHGLRMTVNSRSLQAIGRADATETEITGVLANNIPVGPVLGSPKVTGAGESGRQVAGQPTRIGQVFEVAATGQAYVLLDSGLVPIGEVMKNLLLAGLTSPTTAISANQATSALSQTVKDFDPPGFPATIPEMISSDEAPAMVCAVYELGSSEPPVSVMIYKSPSPKYPLDLNELDRERQRTALDGTRLANVVNVPSGVGALVKLLPAAGDTTLNTTTYLVTDEGLMYAFARVDAPVVQVALGYGGITPLPVPVSLLDLLPVGPTLDPDLARNRVRTIVPTTRAPGPSPSGSTTPPG
jgi:type VII secretion protein EccB